MLYTHIHKDSVHNAIGPVEKWDRVKKKWDCPSQIGTVDTYVKCLHSTLLGTRSKV